LTQSGNSGTSDQCPLLGEEDIATERFTFAAYHTGTQALVEGYPVSRHHHSRNSRRARVPSAGWSGRDLRSAIVRHRSLSFLYVLERGFQIGHLLLGPFCP